MLPPKPPLKPRSSAFDLARGIGILWMLMLHHAAFYHYYAPSRLGLAQGLPVEGDFCYSWTIFCPWGEQFFIALAMANLARGTDAEFRAAFRRRLGKLALLAGACVLSQFLAWSEDIANATIFSPVLAWVCLLAAVAFARAWKGTTGAIVGLSAAWLAIWGGMLVSGGALGYGDWLEDLGRQFLGFNWEYNARPEYFVGSSLAAFVVATLYRLGLPEKKRLVYPLLAALALVLPWVCFGRFTWPDRTGIFSNEYAFARSVEGWLFLTGLSLAVLVGVLELDRRGFGRRVPLLNWLGQHSLAIFLIHAVFQSRVMFPLHAYAAWRFGFPVRLNDFVILASMAGTMVFAWAALRVTGRTSRPTLASSIEP